MKYDLILCMCYSLACQGWERCVWNTIQIKPLLWYIELWPYVTVNDHRFETCSKPELFSWLLWTFTDHAWLIYDWILTTHRLIPPASLPLIQNNWWPQNWVRKTSYYIRLLLSHLWVVLLFSSLDPVFREKSTYMKCKIMKKIPMSQHLASIKIFHYTLIVSALNWKEMKVTT